ncbi:putative coatomer beta subunit [Leptomonas pyrrhocoris]|uniref:Coatomer subunit beta n=1 Tax=Leptomonas pyrrhocoris TaxID=157538 RepID=A0A0M9FSM7_LEPPY|nr:putative coatomer beta subunit [Leptomonas pyrrhocoris]XP_015653675.1 putative coatomer beta subunit [Leptomonas pyrrhocoris]KPA75235.1 putative coatomer beta subunit [Leptomonas pyrrhocoris]KPA75236.1 putative coatomer beta subunit [Leptomonas pyrrhocoris]|eukprot:XP_015653674.1 putative coatomer beta subunit [Leptomonas pyrrhocoris]
MSADVVVSSQEESSTLLVGLDKAVGALSSKEIKDALEKGDMRARAEALKAVIRLHVNGEPQNHLIMTVIRYITPIDDHLIKKLVLYFWEVIDKRDANGLLPVIILICSFLRNDLLHPNEYVRGLTLRFLCKVNEVELIEPLVSAVVQNLSHKVAYVRRNAMLAVHYIYQKFPKLLPDAPELVENAIRQESDVPTCRNGLDFLAAFAPERAASYLSDFRDSHNLASVEGPFLMSVVDFCQQMIRANPYEKARYVPVLLSVLQSKSAAVRFQCATTLLSLSSSPTAIRQATLTYVDLIKSHSDNSVRLIVVEQLNQMRGPYLHVLQDSLLDILSVLQDGTMTIRERVIELAVELVTRRNAETFMQAMRKELLRASRMDSEVEDNNVATAYRLLIIKAMNTALLRHPPSAPSTLPVLLDYVCDSSSTSKEVITLIKEVLLSQPELRRDTLRKLTDVFPMMTSSAVMRTTLWMFGAYTATTEDVVQAFETLKNAVLPLPFVVPKVAVLDAANLTAAAAANNNKINSSSSASAQPNLRAVTTVREDGTYVTTFTTESASPAPTTTTENDSDATVNADVGASGLRQALLKGDYFLAAALASTLTKLVVQLFASADASATVDSATRNTAQSDALAILREVLRYGTAVDTAYPVDSDTHEHLRLNISLLSNPQSAFMVDVLQASTGALARAEQRGVRVGAGSPEAAKGGVRLNSIDAPVIFSQLSEGKDAVFELEATADAAGPGPKEETSERKAERFLKKLEDTTPLSGFNDPVYCEASITVNQFDVAVDWQLVNCTSQQLSNLTIELVSLGGMKLCERPQTYTLNPHETLAVRTSLKVSATETGVIYGTVLYDAPNNQRCSFILNDIHVDIMNYIHPGPCSAAEFREKWGIFDWENKIAVSTTKRDLSSFVRYIVKELNMELLEPYEVEQQETHDPELEQLPTSDEEERCGYVSCNLYAQTAFGEDALANVSVESDGKGLVSGVIRIRSNTQTIAYGIGEKLNMLQKSGRL